MRCRGFSSGVPIGSSVAMTESMVDLDSLPTDDIFTASVTQKQWPEIDVDSTMTDSSLELVPIMIQPTRLAIKPETDAETPSLETKKGPEKALSQLLRDSQ